MNDRLHENWKIVLNEYYNKGLIQEAGGLSSFLNKAKQGGKEFMQGLTGQEQSPLANIKGNIAYDKADKKRGTGTTSKAHRIGMTALDLIHKGLSAMNGKSAKSFKGSYFAKPEDHKQAVEKVRSDINNLCTQLLTLVSTIDALPNSFQVVSMEYTNLADGSNAIQLCPSNMPPFDTQSFNIKIPQQQIIQNGCLNDDKIKAVKNAEWMHNVVNQNIFNKGNVNLEFILNFYKNLNSKLWSIWHDMNDYSLTYLKNQGDSSVWASDRTMQNYLEEWKSIVSLTINEYCTNALNSFKYKVLSHKKIKDDLVPHLFNMPNITNLINTLKEQQLQSYYDNINNMIQGNRS